MIEGFQRVNEYQQQLNQEGADTQLVYMADREGDIYDLYAEHERIVQQGGMAADWLIRSQHDRNTEEGEKIRTLLSKAPRLGEITFHLPKGRDNRKARLVTQTLRAICVPLSPTEKGLPVVTVTAILAQEEHPPQGEQPIQWILLTNRTVQTPEQAHQMLDWYLCRWQIEVFFQLLKSGCKVLAPITRADSTITRMTTVSNRLFSRMATNRAWSLSASKGMEFLRID